MKLMLLGLILFSFVEYSELAPSVQESDSTTKQRENWTIWKGNGTSPVPIVLWHGMGDSCCNPLSMGRIKKLLQKQVPGVYVHSLMLGGGVVSDTEHGYLANMNNLVAEACAIIRYDPKLKNGYHAMGFSQGGLFLRAVAQRCPDPPMFNLVSVGGPQQGIFGFPKCPGDTSICDWVRYLLDLGAYSSYVQNRVVQAQYWHDPYQKDDYKNKNIFLADLNNEKTQNEQYKTNLLKLKNFVLVKFKSDTMVIPKESEWFGFYPENNITHVLDMEETDLYKSDRIGIKTLKESNRLKFITTDGDHLEISEQDLTDKIIKPFFSGEQK
uniref:Palmitoyl-protein thioesterase 1 n=1 Tax=Panagrolaimus sp. JU765 TaxID=591449 RepID=A0AC34RCE2_9BILA